MALVPSGTKRIMHAQTSYDGQDNLGSIDFSQLQPIVQPVSYPQTKTPVPTQSSHPTEQSMEQTVENVSQDPQSLDDWGGETELEFLIKVLEKLGYPPRRLEQYEEDFVSEKIFPGGVREVTMVLPDRYYGTKKRISDKLLSSLINQIQKKFGLTFIDGERSDKKITLNFNSQAPQSVQGEQEEVPGDNLDEIFGVKEKPGQKTKQNKKADTNSGSLRIGSGLKNTIYEMIKESRSKLLDDLIEAVASKKIQKDDPLIEKIKNVFINDKWR